MMKRAPADPGSGPQKKSHERVAFYKYESLSPGQIRLIQLDPGSGDDPLRGRLTPYDFGDPLISYIALSYCWGNHDLAKCLYCPQALPVTSSLDLALRCLRHRSLTILIWADAVCIDQSNIGERNDQLLLMRGIYRGAGKVAIYLGEESSGSDRIPSLASALALAQFSSKVSDPKHVRREMLERLDDAQSALSAWNALLERPWFTRLWVIQEATLATTAIVLCGSWALPFNDLVALAKNLLQIDIHREGSGRQRAPLGGKQLLLMGEVAEEVSKKEQIDLLWLFERSRRSVATNSIDYLYGVLGLGTHAEQMALRPDYGEDVSDTLLRYGKYFIDSGRGMDMLFFVHGSSWQRNIPTWIPGWTVHEGSGLTRPQNMEWPRLKQHLHDTMPLLVGLDFLQTRSQLNLSDDGRTLYVGGRELSTIHALGPDARDYLPNMDQMTNEGILKMVKDGIKTLDRLLEPFEAKGKGQSKMEWGDLIRELSYMYWDVPKHERESRLLSLIDEAVTAVLDGFEMPLHSVAVFMYDILTCQILRICRTSEGAIFQVPYESRLGDKMVQLLGCKYPFILRLCNRDNRMDDEHMSVPSTNPCYRVVGPFQRNHSPRAHSYESVHMGDEKTFRLI